MTPMKFAVLVTWVAFWAYWLLSARGTKDRTRAAASASLPRGVTGLALIVVLVTVRVDRLAVHDLALEIVGASILVAGIATAVWARVNLGRNWGTPMSRQAEPELVTSGPYRLVRHPIYSGLLLAMLGTALATDLLGLVVVAMLGAYFVHAAKVEERNLIEGLPAAYPAYRARTRMLIPFVL